MTDDHRDTRERLLDAAEALFARRGYDAASIRDIAAAAEVNVAAVNYHFHGKDRLYREVLRRAVEAKRDRHIAQMDAFRAGGDVDPADAVRSFFRAHFEDVLKTEQGGNFLRLFVRELHHGSTEVAQMILRSLQPMWESLAGVVLDGVPGADASHAPWIIGSLHGQLIHFTMRWRATPSATDRTGMADDAEDAGAFEAMRLLFPPLADDVDEYIDLAVEHITRFSVAGIRAVIAGQSEEEPS